MMKAVSFMAGVFAGVILAFHPAAAQEEDVGGELVRVYLDCQSGCDSDYIRTEITFVDYVRDRTTSDVHLLITAEGTGAGGRAFTLNFIGRNRFDGANDTLRYTSSGDATSDDIRRGLTRTIKVGLVRFAASTPAGDRLDIRFEAPAENSSSTTAPARDPWNFWVFSIGTHGFMNGESSQKFMNVGGSLSASRTTATWKMSFDVEGNYREQKFEIDSVTTEQTFNRQYSAGFSVVRSIGGRFSTGFQGVLSASTFGNEKLVVRVAPAIEYNVFPYTQSTRRLFTLTYSVGGNSYNYREVTIYGQTSETLPAHNFTSAYTTRQPWGSTSLSLSGSQFLHDRSKYRLQGFGSANIRVFRGFSLNFFGSYAKIRDQLSIEAGELTPEEILLQQRQRQTGYSYFLNFGVSYRFGSLFSPVVNPRMSRFFGGGSECC